MECHTVNLVALIWIRVLMQVITDAEILPDNFRHNSDCMILFMVRSGGSSLLRCL